MYGVFYRSGLGGGFLRRPNGLITNLPILSPCLLTLFRLDYQFHTINLAAIPIFITFAPCLNQFYRTMSDIASRVKAIIVDKLGVDESEITNESSFTNDLGADSLDTVELIMEFEKEFNIAIPDDQAEKISTVGQAVDYISANVK